MLLAKDSIPEVIKMMIVKITEKKYEWNDQSSQWRIDEWEDGCEQQVLQQKLEAEEELKQKKIEYT